MYVIAVYDFNPTNRTIASRGGMAETRGGKPEEGANYIAVYRSPN